MTNSDIIEEVMHKAYYRGFFHLMHDKVREIEKEKKMEQVDLYTEAYRQLKMEYKDENETSKAI